MAAAILEGINIFAPLATKAFEALEAVEPDVAALIKDLPGTMKGAVSAVAPNNGVGLEAAMAHNVSIDSPTVDTSEFARIKTVIGNAVAIYATLGAGPEPWEEAAWTPIMVLVEKGIKAQGVDIASINSNTLKCWVSGGIEMYRAGVGVKAITLKIPQASAVAATT